MDAEEKLQKHFDELMKKHSEAHKNDTVLDNIYHYELKEYYYEKYLNDGMIQDMWKKQNENTTMQDVLLQSWKDFLDFHLIDILFNMDTWYCDDDDCIAIIKLKHPATFKKTTKNTVQWLLTIFPQYGINIIDKPVYKIDHYSDAIEYTA